MASPPLAGYLLESGHIDAAQSRALRQQLVSLSTQLKEHAVDLVDAYAPPDSLIASALGKRGVPYQEALWEKVRGCTARASYWRRARTPVQVCVERLSRCFCFTLFEQMDASQNVVARIKARL